MRRRYGDEEGDERKPSEPQSDVTPNRPLTGKSKSKCKMQNAKVTMDRGLRAILRLDFCILHLDFSWSSPGLRFHPPISSFIPVSTKKNPLGVRSSDSEGKT